MANDSSFLGKGWSFPPSFTASGKDVEMVAGADDIHQSLQILLATRIGERIMHDDYGCDLSTVQFEEMDQSLINTIKSLISNAILYHEPRIKLERLEIATDENQAGLLFITMEYTVRGTNSRYNMVYPFYLNEATAGGF